MDKNNVYHLKYSDINRDGFKGIWKLLESENDTLNIEFHFYDKNVTGKLKGNTLLFEKQNVFDQRFVFWLYGRTNLDQRTIIK